MGRWTTYPFEGAVAVLFDFGDIAPELLTSKSSIVDLGQAWETFRIRLIPCDIEDMLRRHAPDTAGVKALARDWERNARRAPEDARGPVLENARLFLAIRAVLQKENARAAAINCHAMPQHGLRLPCTAMVQLHREGMLLACEMDVNGLLSSMLLTHLAARPAFMGNVIPGSDDGSVDISHCVAPPDMLPGLAGYEFADHHGNRNQATAAIELPMQGEATLARISPGLEYVHFAVGRIVQAHHEGTCRNSVTVRLPDCRTFLNERLDGHYALVCGDVSMALSQQGTLGVVA